MVDMGSAHLFSRGDVMNVTLRPEDRNAIDLLLDRGAAAAGDGNAGGATFAPADPAMGQRVARVQKLLHLLDAVPQPQPPQDLVARTLRFIDQAAHQPVGRPIPNLIGTQRPVV